MYKESKSVEEHVNERPAYSKRRSNIPHMCESLNRRDISSD